jgi:peroxiredoxin
MPSGTLTLATHDGPQKISAEEYFKGRKVVLFSVPGAFTPTCDAKHLPGFVQKADEIKGKGVDKIACLAVNDAFVMKAWGKSQGADGKVDMLADGNAEYTKALGLEMDATGYGMGIRGQRFALVVEDGVVKQVNVEEKGEFKVSSAEHVLTQL